MRHIIFSISEIVGINTIQKLTSWSVHFHDYLPKARCIKSENWFVQLQISNSLKLKICLICSCSFIEAKSYKSTLFRDWKWKTCLSDSRPCKNKLMCVIVWQEGYVTFTVVRGRGEIMASMLKVVITPKGLRTTALYIYFFNCSSFPAACDRKQAIQRDVLRQSFIFDGYSALGKWSCYLP